MENGVFVTGALDGASLLEDRLDDLLQRTVGRWQICPLWALRGRMFTLAEKALIIALLDVWHTAGRPEWFWGTRESLAKLMGSSEETFRLARKRLEAKCIIKRQRGRQHTASRYQFSHDFLYTLTKEPPSLKTSTLSKGVDSSGLELNGGAQSARF